MMKVKTIAICLSFIGLGAAGVIVAAPQAGKDRPAPSAGQGRQAARRQAPHSAPATDAGKGKVQPPLHVVANYVIEPPDIIIVEVLEALPGRPISGERLVRPDGKISLGFYGEVYVAGLTLMEAKEKIILHLRKWISDTKLGLLADDETGAPNKQINPRDSDRVFVDVTKMNSKNYYVLGAVRIPGRLPFTGRETVLDALNHVGGLTDQADHDNVVLYRPAPPGVKVPPQRLPVVIDQIMMGDDPTTNYQMMPGDRLVIPTKPGADSEIDDPGPDRPSGAREPSAAPRMSDRRPPSVRAESLEEEDSRREVRADRSPTLRDIERRLGEVERKLDRVLDALERRDR